MRYFLLYSPLLQTRLLSISISFSSNPRIRSFLLSSPSLLQTRPLSSSSSLDLNPSEVASSFEEWFKPPIKFLSIFDQIYKILTPSSSSSSSSVQDSVVVNAAFSPLNLNLTEQFVLHVLRHHPHRIATTSTTTKEDAMYLFRRNFFKWSGSQPGYQHSLPVYHAFFSLLSRARLLEWLQDFSEKHKSPHLLNTRFYETLVVGCAVAGLPELALQFLDRMYSEGFDLDSYSYHVLLNSLVENSLFQLADAVLSQIYARGFTGPDTASIKMKSLCCQNKLDEAWSYLFSELGQSVTDSTTITVLIDHLCKERRFNEASFLVEEFGSAHVYGFWISNLLDVGLLDEAMCFLNSKKMSKNYVPNRWQYNKLIFHLLRENRLEQMYDLLVEMMEQGISPNISTMNALIAFFCKAGIDDVAFLLYNSMLDKGYFPCKQTFNILTNAPTEEEKLDKMRKLFDTARKKDVKPADVVLASYVCALCKAGKPEEAYLLPQMMNENNTGLGGYKHTYTNLILAFIDQGKVDIPAQLIIEMQKHGHVPSLSLYSAVISLLFKTSGLDHVLILLKMQLALKEPDQYTSYSYFIYGAKQAQHPELAVKVYNRMMEAGIQPKTDTKILILKSFLKSRRIVDAIEFFNYLREKREPGNKLYKVLLTGLCQARKPEEAIKFFWEARRMGMIPRLECYEQLVNELSSKRNYDMVIKVLEDYEKTGRPISPSICNVLLSHTLKGQNLMRAWIKRRGENRDCISGEVSNKGPETVMMMLYRLISTFSTEIRIKNNLENLDKVVEKFFVLDIVTYNILLRGQIMAGRMDYACNLFDRICKEGYKPDRWTFEFIIRGFRKHGEEKEADRWLEKMKQNGFS